MGTLARGALQRALGLRGGRFLVVVTGGAEGIEGRIYRRTAASSGGSPATSTSRSSAAETTRFRRQLTEAGGAGRGRLTVQGFVDNMADWLLCADVVVDQRAGTIAEQHAAGPLLLTSYVPSQGRWPTSW